MAPELKIVELLTALSQSQSSGLLQVIEADITWSLLLESGNLKYASCSVQSLSQLDFQLRRMGDGMAAAIQALSTFQPPNPPVTEPIILQGVSWLKKDSGLLTTAQTSQLIQQLTRDTVELLSWLTQGTHYWLDNQLAPSLQSLIGNRLSPTDFHPIDLPSLLSQLQQRFQGWSNCSPAIHSPYQRPYVLDHRLLQKPIPGGMLAPTTLENLAKLMRGVSIRQLALLVKQDELKFAQLLAPYVRHGVICLREPQSPYDKLPTIPSLPEPISVSPPYIGAAIPSTAKNYQILCIDDSPTILEEMERFLGQNTQYTLTKVDDPIKAASIIFQLNPDLILMDITMPGINGYKLCSLFRSSETLAEIPIVMVTGNTGLIDKARAKMVGATDYLTKPFDQHRLMAVVEKYLP